jgi:hypothetical protein
VTRHQLWALGVVLAALGLALTAGPHRRGALLGVGLSGGAGLLSMRAMGRYAARGKVMQQAILVMALGFLVRIALVALGTILVVRAGWSVPGFVLGFFVVYFALAGIEGAYVQRLGRGARSSA